MQTNQPSIVKCAVSGMTCRSCEITVEREWRKIAGVRKVDVNAAKGVARIVCSGDAPSIEVLQATIAEHGYTVRGMLTPTTPSVASTLGVDRSRLSWWQLLGLFALVAILGSLFSRLGLLAPSIALGATTSIGAVFLLGLLAASSSCIAVSGGLLLSSAAKFNARYAPATPFARMRPVFLFIGGRLFAYTFLGGMIGMIGKALSPSPFATGIITLLAALYMLVMGLDMLAITPRWLKALTPRLPKSLAHRFLAVEEKEHAATPFLLGAATFFLPCGFTQALQLYALTTGNFVTGASLLFAFALGTAPALLALGWASGSLKGRAGRFFFQFAGALVVMLGLWNIQNGLTIIGYPINFSALRNTGAGQAQADTAVFFDGREQVMRMKLSYTGYAPNRFTIRAGVPTRWVVDAGTGGGGCLSVLQAPILGIRTFLNPGENVIAFTAPSSPGVIPFSCSMGMYWGEIVVI